MYSWLRNGLFLLPPEIAHDVALGALARGRWIGLPRILGGCPSSAPVELMGLAFPNPVGLAAGLDKNGDYIDALGDLGFGFIEVGTVTPEPQEVIVRFVTSAPAASNTARSASPCFIVPSSFRSVA